MNIQLDELLDRFYNYLAVERRLAGNTLQSYGNDLRKYFEFLKSRNAKSVLLSTRVDLLSFLNGERKRGVSARSLARTLSCIKTFFKYLVQDGLLDKSPIHDVETPRQERRLPNILSVSEVEALIKAPEIDTPLGLRNRALFELIYATGLRVSELVSLSLNSINLEAGYILVLGKGSKERVIPVGEEALRWVKLYTAESRQKLLAGKTSKFLFTNRSGARMSRQGFWKIIKKY